MLAAAVALAAPFGEGGNGLAPGRIDDRCTGRRVAPGEAVGRSQYVFTGDEHECPGAGCLESADLVVEGASGPGSDRTAAGAGHGRGDERDLV